MIMALHSPSLAPILGILSALIAIYIVKPVLVREMRLLAARTDSEALPIFLDLLEGYLTLWILLGAAAATASAAALETGHLNLIHGVIRVCFLTSVTWAFVRFLSETAKLYGRQLRASEATTRLVSRLLQILVIVIGAMLVLSNLGISITPLLTALGVSSLAVALALQDSLGNFFAGIVLVASKTVEAGHYVKLDSGQEGTIVDVGWRTTQMYDLGNHLILIPNTKLAQAVVTNFHKPDPDLSVSIQMSVPYETDLEMFERISLEAATEIQQLRGGALKDFKPVFRYQQFTDTGAQCAISLRAAAFADRFLMTHEFLKRFHARMRQERIPFPYPRQILEK